MIELKFTGNAHDIREEMTKLLGVYELAEAIRQIRAPAVSDVSSDNKPLVLDEAKFLGNNSADVQPVEQTQPTPAKRTRKPKADPAPVEPLKLVTADLSGAPIDVTDDHESDTARQDAADEAAENEGGPVTERLLTLDDVRNSALPYITKWGKEAAAKDLVPIVQAAGGVPNIGKLDPTDQALLRKVMAAFADAAKADKRFGQE